MINGIKQEWRGELYAKALWAAAARRGSCVGLTMIFLLKGSPTAESMFYHLSAFAHVTTYNG